MSFHDFPGDGQAEPRAAFTGGAPDAGPAIRLEELVAFGFGNARPLILNRNCDATLLRPRAHFNCGSGLRKLDCVGDQIVQHLLDLPFIEQQLGQCAFDLKSNVNMLLPRQLGVETNVVFEQFSRIRRAAVQFVDCPTRSRRGPGSR